MRQFCRRQILAIQVDASSFVIDYKGFNQIPLAKTILQEWFGKVNMKESTAENRFEDVYINEYKKWLQDDLYGVVNPTPCMVERLKMSR